VQETLRAIVWHGRKMSTIVDELLMLAEIRDKEIELAPLDMAAIVAEAQQRLAYMVEDPQAEIIVPAAWPVALGYAPWVEEVWVNYLSNAIKYGGRPPRVELGADHRVAQSAACLPRSGKASQSGGAEAGQGGGYVRFWVRDNGPGLTPEEQARLFTPFTRLDQSRARGHGLGLSIVRRIVERLGGQVGVESEVGQGCLFSFTLPAAAHDAAPN